jgi:hypothetical protein
VEDVQNNAKVSTMPIFAKIKTILATCNLLLNPQLTHCLNK